ncbi:DNA topoisomerase III [Fusibacter paucivorans]|uniref:DNA topoisomerase 3 n=1 Tax=Fusibacter paucivorans TaxID=76009 RepID=A0ABS5PQG0_9FIRM|nr:DNA topoisomerase III [Fusibacter paucivorans]MBS7527291.1 DNA topoisomerase III [Fusibacter paucivorans]
MSKTVVLAEKPSVGRDIARVLNCHRKGNQCLEGDRYIVTWALGHLVTLADPDYYDQKLANWRLEDLPMLPSPLALVVIKQTSGHFKAVRQTLLRKDVSDVIIATDAGREGELVARWIIEKAGLKKPLKRLWISSVTDKAIREGFSKLKDGRAYNALYDSAKARSEADWYVGMNATRALTCKFNAQLSCGRVQTPTLAMIAQREADIQQFKAKDYFGLAAHAKGFKLTWADSQNHTRTFNEATVKTLHKELQGERGVVSKVESKRKNQSAPGLYDLTELQRDANKRFGFSAKQTLNIMQRLYEVHKILTYPRTDSRYLTADIVPTLKDRIKACGNGEYAKIAFQLIKSPIKPTKAFVDDAKVSDHHAIIPTEQAVFLNDLYSDERKVYDLVVKRFLAVLMPPYCYDQTTVDVVVKNQRFTAKGKVEHSLGWRAVYQAGSAYDNDEESDDDLRDQQLPVFQKGQSVEIKHLEITRGRTMPPPPYTEGTLLTAMEHPLKNMPYGIGTVATRADIIEKLLNTFLVEKRGNHLHMTGKGKQLLELVPEDLKSAELTADWEQQLERIANGKLSKKQFIEEIKQFSKRNVKMIKDSDATFKHQNVTREKCPDCGKYLLEVNGKKGKMLVCQDRTCGYRKGVARVTNARCPNCHKKMMMRGEGDQKIFTCQCGYREKLSAFNERKKAADKQGSRRDVEKFIREQAAEQAQPASPFAEALAKLNLKE